MMSVCVDPKKINEVWPHFKHLIERAVKKGTSEFGGIESDVLTGHSLLWLAYDGKVHAAAVTKLYDGVCEITACSGAKLKTFLPLIKDLEAYARDEKCRAVRVVGRRGWIRVLGAYKPVATVLERAL